MFWGIHLWWEAPEINQSKEARGPELPSTAAEFQQFIWIACWRNLSLHWLDKEPRKACDLSLNIQTILVLCWLQGWVGFFSWASWLWTLKLSEKTQPWRRPFSDSCVIPSVQFDWYQCEKILWNTDGDQQPDVMENWTSSSAWPSSCVCQVKLLPQCSLLFYNIYHIGSGFWHLWAVSMLIGAFGVQNRVATP